MTGKQKVCIEVFFNEIFKCIHGFKTKMQLNMQIGVRLLATLLRKHR